MLRDLHASKCSTLSCYSNVSRRRNTASRACGIFSGSSTVADVSEDDSSDSWEDYDSVQMFPGCDCGHDAGHAAATDKDMG